MPNFVMRRSSALRDQTAADGAASIGRGGRRGGHGFVWLAERLRVLAWAPMPPRQAARLGLLLLLLPGPAGCGPTEAERRIAGIADGMAQTVAVQRDCRAAAFDRPDRAEFARRMPMVAEHATPAQLADRARVRPGQRAALRLLRRSGRVPGGGGRARGRRCRNLGQ
jgi:hypothetical protein